MKLADSIGREAVIVLGGAILAAVIIGQIPELRAWIARQWAGAKPGGCTCSR